MSEIDTSISTDDEIIEIKMDDDDERLEFDILDEDGALDLDFDSSGKVDYISSVYNKPKINGVIVVGNKEDVDYNLQRKMHALTVQEVQSILYMNKGRITNHG